MKTLNKEEIKSTLKSKGWEDIELLIQEEKQKIRDTMDIDVDNKTSADKVAIRVQAKNEAFKAFERFFKRLKNIERENPQRKTPLI
jgi:hypothetical protein